MGLLDGIKSLKAGEGLIHLSQTTVITAEQIKDPVWAELLDDYRNTTGAEKQCAVSIFNAALTHQRRVFVLTRDGVERLVRTDPNWGANAPVFNSKKWSSYLLFMYERGILKKIYEKRVSVFELVFGPLLGAIPDSEEHRRQAVDFANNDVKTQTAKSESGFTQSAIPQAAEQKYKIYVPDPEELKKINEKYNFERPITDEELDAALGIS